MFWKTIKAFFYGVLLFAGIAFAMDLPYYLGGAEKLIWGIEFYLYLGLIGGATFIISWLSLYAVWRIFKALTEVNNNV